LAPKRWSPCADQQLEIEPMTQKSKQRSILVPVDFSPHSEAAMVFAAKLADWLDTSLLVLHVVHDPAETPGYYKRKKKQLQRIEDAAGEMMAEFIEQVAAKNPELKQLAKAKSLLVAGLPVTRILEIVDKHQPQMVVMGSLGRTGLAHITLGSKAEQAMRLCPVPVTIVKTRKK
jgi:nucleotide-binding universal stress UspA family protein